MIILIVAHLSLDLTPFHRYQQVKDFDPSISWKDNQFLIWMDRPKKFTRFEIHLDGVRYGKILTRTIEAKGGSKRSWPLSSGTTYMESGIALSTMTVS